MEIGAVQLQINCHSLGVIRNESWISCCELESHGPRVLPGTTARRRSRRRPNRKRIRVRHPIVPQTPSLVRRRGEHDRPKNRPRAPGAVSLGAVPGCDLAIPAEEDPIGTRSRGRSKALAPRAKGSVCPERESDSADGSDVKPDLSVLRSLVRVAAGAEPIDEPAERCLRWTRSARLAGPRRKRHGRPD